MASMPNWFNPASGNLKKRKREKVCVQTQGLDQDLIDNGCWNERKRTAVEKAKWSAYERNKCRSALWLTNKSTADWIHAPTPHRSVAIAAKQHVIGDKIRFFFNKHKQRDGILPQSHDVRTMQGSSRNKPIASITHYPLRWLPSTHTKYSANVHCCSKHEAAIVFQKPRQKKSKLRNYACK